MNAADLPATLGEELKRQSIGCAGFAVKVFMADKRKPAPSEKNSISISGDVRDSTVIAGDNNVVNQTFIQKFFNIFKSDSETLEQRNRRILEVKRPDRFAQNLD